MNRYQVFVGLVVLSFSSLMLAQDFSELYSSLEKQCDKRVSKGCCLSSVSNMRDLKVAPLIGQKDCPAGFRKDQLKCPDSFAWCEKIEGHLEKQKSP